MKLVRSPSFSERCLAEGEYKYSDHLQYDFNGRNYTVNCSEMQVSPFRPSGCFPERRHQQRILTLQQKLRVTTNKDYAYQKKNNILFYLLILTGFLMLLELSFLFNVIVFIYLIILLYRKSEYSSFNSSRYCLFPLCANSHSFTVLF